VPKGRLEAFSDGVIAILITIMVLELHTPAGTSWHALGEELPVLLAYALSFVYLGIYWNNHHHMLAAVSPRSRTTSFRRCCCAPKASAPCCAPPSALT
jgi:uncharacterized membrane protein